MDISEVLQRIKPVLGDLEEERHNLMAERRRLLPRVYLGLILLATSIVLTVVYSGQTIGKWAIGGIVVFAIYTLYVLVSFTWEWKEVKRKIKQAILTEVIKTINPEWTYQADGYVPRTRFVESGIFAIPDSYSGEDLIEGSKGRIRFQMSEVKALKSRSGSQGPGSSTIFAGFMIVLECDQDFIGDTYVFPNYATKLFGSWLGKAIQKMGSNHPLVHVRHPEFGKSFKVYASQPSAVERTLSITMIQAILKIKERQKTSLYLSFRDNYLTMALAWPLDYLEPDIYTKKPIAESEWIHRVVGEVSSTLDIVDALAEGV